MLIIFCHFLQAHKHSCFSVTTWYSFMRIKVVGIYSWLLISYIFCTISHIHSFSMLDIIISLFLKYSDNVSTSQSFIYFMLANVYIECNLATHMCWGLQIGFKKAERERERKREMRKNLILLYWIFHSYTNEGILEIHWFLTIHLISSKCWTQFSLKT